MTEIIIIWEHYTPMFTLNIWFRIILRLVNKCSTVNILTQQVLDFLVLYVIFQFHHSIYYYSHYAQVPIVFYILYNLIVVFFEIKSRAFRNLSNLLSRLYFFQQAFTIIILIDVVFHYDCMLETFLADLFNTSVLCGKNTSTLLYLHLIHIFLIKTLYAYNYCRLLNYMLSCKL